MNNKGRVCQERPPTVDEVRRETLLIVGNGTVAGCGCVVVVAFIAGVIAFFLLAGALI